MFKDTCLDAPALGKVSWLIAVALMSLLLLVINATAGNASEIPLTGVAADSQPSQPVEAGDLVMPEDGMQVTIEPSGPAISNDESVSEPGLAPGSGAAIDSEPVAEPDTATAPEVLPAPDTEPAAGLEVAAPAANSPSGMDAALAQSVKGMEMWQFISNSRVLAELYTVKEVVTEKIDGKEIKLTVREARYDEMMEMDNAPMTIVTIGSNGFEVRQPLYFDRRMEFEHSISKQTRPGLLVINERCGCVDPYGDLAHIFTLYKGAFIPLGAVSGVEDLDGNGVAEPFVFDASLSNGIGYMDEYSGPVARIPFAVIRGRLVVVKDKYAPFYLERIESLDKRIKEDHANSPQAADLSPVLEKLLYYKAAGMEDEGWKALKSDLMLYGGEVFPVRMDMGDVHENAPVEEIISRVRKALGKSGLVN